MSTWQTLLRMTRAQLGDPDGSRWTNTDLIDYFVEAEERACRMGYLIRAEKTATLVASTTAYSYPTNSLYILDMVWGGSTTPMEHRTNGYMNRMYSGWNSGDTTGGPRIYVTDRVTKKFHVYPTPDSTAVSTSSTLTMVCVMLPSATPTIDEFRDETSTPEIEPEHHFELIDYVKYRAHNQDSESGGAQKAANDLAVFNHNMEMAKREFMKQRNGRTSQFPSVI